MKTAQTIRAIERTLESEGHPKNWTMSEARALFATLPERALFDDVEDFVAACFLIQVPLERPRVDPRGGFVEPDGRDTIICETCNAPFDVIPSTPDDADICPACWSALVAAARIATLGNRS